MDLTLISILAIIQGITEFLPISSSAHLALAPSFLGYEDPGLTVDAFLHLGTVFAALIYFRKDIFELTKGLFSSGNSQNDYKKLAIGIIIATLPVLVVGFFAKDFFSSYPLLRSKKFIAFTLTAGAILMLAGEIYSKKLTKHKNLFESNFLAMFFIGCMQALALFPGVSRSGSTIAAALFCGIHKTESARLAFLVGLPAITAAGLLSIKELVSLDGFDMASSMPALSLGFLLSFLSGYFAIDFLLKFLKNQSLISFVVYRIALAIILLF